MLVKSEYQNGTLANEADQVRILDDGTFRIVIHGTQGRASDTFKLGETYSELGRLNSVHVYNSAGTLMWRKSATPKDPS